MQNGIQVVTLIDDSLMYNKIFLAMIIGNKKQFYQYVIREIIYFKLFRISWIISAK